MMVNLQVLHLKVFFQEGESILSNWTKIFTVIASEGKQSQPLELLHFTSFHMANATQRLRNDIV
jgi:hypothetical protein